MNNPQDKRALEQERIWHEADFRYYRALAERTSIADDAKKPFREKMDKAFARLSEIDKQLSQMKEEGK